MDVNGAAECQWGTERAETERRGSPACARLRSLKRVRACALVSVCVQAALMRWLRAWNANAVPLCTHQGVRQPISQSLLLTPHSPSIFIRKQSEKRERRVEGPSRVRVSTLSQTNLTQR